MDALTHRELVDRFEALEMLNAMLDQQLWALKEEVESHSKDLEELKKEFESTSKDLEDLEKLNKEVELINKDLERQNRELQKRHEDLVSYFHLTLGFLVCLIFIIVEYP